MFFYSSRKRTYDTFSQASAGRTDWLCDPSVKMDVLRAVLTKDMSANILVAGIGHSTLGYDLKNEGHTNVTVTDLDNEQVSPENRALSPRYFNLLDPVPQDLKGRFDYVIDSSVTDVFMQLTRGTVPNLGTAIRAHNTLLSMLKSGGAMIIYSMNNAAWDKIYQHKRMIRQHLRIRPTFHVRTKKGRTTKMQGEDVLVMVASAEAFQIRRVETDDAYALLTEWSASLPEDWQSQRE